MIHYIIVINYLTYGTLDRVKFVIVCKVKCPEFCGRILIIMPLIFRGKTDNSFW